MNTSGKSYKELAIPYFREVFEIIDSTLKEQGIPYYLIGASAMALELLKKNIAPARGTKDIDFAIMISKFDEFHQVTKSLEEKGLHKVRAPWTFFSEEYNVVIDLLPFGEIEEQDTLQFNERFTDLHVLGFKEVMEDPSQAQIEDVLVNIPSLSGMVILKWIAWSDRPDERQNDLADILRIIQHYFDFDFDEIVEFYNETFPGEDQDFDKLLIAAEVLGIKARKYLKRSDKLEERIMQVMADQINALYESDIARIWARQLDKDIDYTLSILRAFEKGIKRV